MKKLLSAGAAVQLMGARVHKRMRRKAHSQPPWGVTSLTSVGALTIQARQLNIVGEEERRRETEKEEEEAKNKIKLGDKAAKQSC